MRHWTDEDIETLMRLYRSHGPTELAAIQGRTPRAVLDKWRYERYKALPDRRRQWWTDEEVALLRQAARTTPTWPHRLASRPVRRA